MLQGSANASPTIQGIEGADIFRNSKKQGRPMAAPTEYVILNAVTEGVSPERGDVTQ